MSIRKMVMVLMLVAPWVAGGCASHPGQQASLDEKLSGKGYSMGEPVSSIRDWRLNGWIYVDNEHFIIRSGVKDYYLVTLKSPCLDLNGAFGLTFSNTASSLTDKDRVYIRNSPAGFREVYFIDTLHRLQKTAPAAGSG